MAKVELEHVRKVYPNGYVAVDDASFRVAEGELLALVGPSGCGKSTLLRMIAGLESISSGVLRIGARPVNDVPPKGRDIAMVFQNYALYPHMRVDENLAFGLKLRGMPKAQIQARVREAAEMLELGALLDRKPAQLSGGQRQRVALGRALVRDPQVFLLDEPLSNLDAKLRASMRVEIARLHRKLGTTMLYVTHDQIEAMTLGQRIVVMQHGVIQQIDAPMALYREPANVFVAGFLGSPAMNLFTGVLQNDNAWTLRLGDGLQFPIAAGAALPAHWNGREVIMGVRPEHVLQAQTSRPAIDASVDVVEHVGSEMLVNLLASGRKLVARFPPDACLEIDAGRHVRIAFDHAHLHWFDPTTGLRLSVRD